MATPRNELSVSALAQAVVSQDAELRNALRDLVMDSINVMRYTMHHGMPAEKLQIAKTLTPHLLGAIKNVDADEGEKEKRAAYERMMAQLRGEEVADEDAA